MKNEQHETYEDNEEEHSGLRSLIGGLDVQHTVGIKLEDDFNLRNTMRSRRDTGKLELADKVVVLGYDMFTLKYLNKDGVLVIGGHREAENIVSKS